MVAQAPVNGTKPESSASEGVSKGLGDFIGDVLSLAELQVQLLNVDLREAGTKSKGAVFCGVGALVLALGSVPILFTAIAWSLIERAGMAHDVAFLASFVLGAAVAGGVGWFAWQRLNTAAPIVTRSAGELRQNLRWIKHALQKRRTAPKD